ncbi:O-antigen ligase [Novosphingobium sp. Gsoil 351]|uniref:O-antigen ligase family protein n=1 Tax=Novosphingobium sp. Gsoil 351 TaxID=2675225 RepID=UPI0012B4F842|nr:O-antigen ligase family protein [Novosphingobium sp. Gsoil 351]QGN56102.1 hypothetical protein GKE62_17675 [Novosphingobium sp. Gsoil 351]
MKWIVLAALIAAVPALMEWLRSNPSQAPWLSGLLGVLIFVYSPYNLSVAPYPWPMWPGYVKGVKITVLDVVALAIVLNNWHNTCKNPFIWPMIFYLIAVIIAMSQSPVPQASSFYVWQLLRFYVVFRAVAIVAQDDRHCSAIVAGLILGVAFQALEAGWARAHGAAQSGGTLGHQNLLGMLTNMVLMPSIAMALAGIRVRWATFGVLVCVIALIFTASRASLSLGAVGAGLTVVLSLLRKPTSRKTGMAVLAVLALALSAPLAMSSLSNRFKGSDVSFSFDSDDVRLRMNQAAGMMINDFPLGVGSNYFVVAANSGNYWKRAGVPVTKGNMGANVHNSYLLVEAETGVIGLVTMLILLSCAIAYPLYISFTNRKNVRGDILSGLSIAFVTFVIHNRVEWGFVSENVQYMLAVILGLIAGLSRSIKVAASTARSVRQKALPDAVRGEAGSRIDDSGRSSSPAPRIVTYPTVAATFPLPRWPR